MDNMGELVLQNSIDDAETHTLEATTSATRTSSCKHNEQNHWHQLDRPQSIIDGGKSCRSLHGDNGEEALSDGFLDIVGVVTQYQHHCTDERGNQNNDEISRQLCITEEFLHFPLEDRIIY